jgi:hypothetical protein
MFEDRPAKDWTNHPSDAFRMMSIAWRKEMEPDKPKPPPKIELLQTVSYDRLVEANERKRTSRI